MIFFYKEKYNIIVPNQRAQPVPGQDQPITTVI